MDGNCAGTVTDWPLSQKARAHRFEPTMYLVAAGLVRPAGEVVGVEGEGRAAAPQAVALCGCGDKEYSQDIR